MHVFREHFGVTVKPAQASAVCRIDRHLNRLPAFAQVRHIRSEVLVLEYGYGLGGLVMEGHCFAVFEDTVVRGL